MKKLLKLLFYILSISCNFVVAQSISNITASQSGKSIVVSYNLTGNEEIKAYEIKLYVSPDGGSTWQGPLTSVSGDVGKNQVGGYDKSITWEVLTEPGFKQLKGDNIQFKIKALYSNVDEIEMVWAEGGSFMMGSKEGEEDEKPVHKVILNGFYIGKYEVTQEQWEQVMGYQPSKNKGCKKCPVENVDWYEVQQFIRKLSLLKNKKFRLPTEAEWEFAAKGGNENSNFKYTGSDSINEVAWYDSNSNFVTHPIGTKKANVLGLYDMTGNVWERCSDWYDKNYYKYSPKSNPEGGLSGDSRVLRGGSFNCEYNCRVTLRSIIGPNYRDGFIGFRLAYSMDE